ncbi:MAG: hypothetical protein ACR2HJ_12610 [Fimbriimonadales bacterium]
MKPRVGQVIVALAFAFIAVVANSQTGRKALVVFPFGLGEDVMEAKEYKLQDELTRATHALVRQDEKFTATLFARTHPSVKRALAEGSLKSALLLEPFTGEVGGQPKSVILGKLVRGQLALAGLVESFEYDATKKSARLVASIELYDIVAAKLLGTVVLTTDAPGETEAEAAKATAAKLAGDAVPQAVKILTAPPKKDGGAPTP